MVGSGKGWCDGLGDVGLGNCRLEGVAPQGIEK